MAIPGLRGRDVQPAAAAPAADGAATAVPDAEFVQVFTRHQRRLYLYILSQVPSPIAAEEILQEANVVIWSKFRQFQPGTNFLAWSTQIANYEILKHRTKRKRDRLMFSDEFIHQVAEEALERSDELERRRAALVHCIEKLRPADRELIQHRYAPGETGKNLAEALGRPANSVYQSLGRIRRTLWECVQRRLAAET
jgi:RNA polymerase sigma-70 factor (ECF subfamily)